MIDCMLSPSRSPLGRRSAAAVAVCAAFVATGGVACSSNTDTDTVAAAAAPSTTEESGGLNSFCAAAPRAGDEVPEAYVGSTENVADLRDLARIAPDDVAADVEQVADYFDENVDPADPDSQLVENFPDGIAEKIQNVTSYIEANCGS